MAETTQVEPIGIVDIGGFTANNGTVTLGHPIKITTPPEQWSYAANLELTYPSAGELVLLQVTVLVTRGRVGIGCVQDDFSTFIDEVEAAASERLQTVHLILPRDHKPKALIIRNVAPDGQFSEALVYSVELVNPPSGMRGVATAVPVLRPMPNWSHYYGQMHETIDERMRKLWYDGLSQPAEMTWLHGLKLRLLPKNEMLRAVYVSGVYEPNSLMVLSDILSPGDVFVDVGANVGLFTLFAAPIVGPHGAVIAIEASRREFDRLTDNVSLNHLGNVRTFHIALSDKPGTVDLSIADDLHGGHNTLAQSFTYQSVEKIATEQVTADTLDRLIERDGITRIDLVKMDIEGAELMAIRGARNTLRKFQPVLLLEVLESTLAASGGSVAELEAELTGAGYRFWEIDNATGERKPVAALSAARSENIVASVRELPSLGSGQSSANSSE